MFSFSWPSIGRVVLIGILAYIALIVLLRITGKRTLTKLNAFDLVVTVAIGSTLATILLNQKVSIFQGITALATLVFLQFVFAWSSIRSTFINRLIKAEPKLLFYQGHFFEQEMEKERIQRIEVLQAVRNQGMASMDLVEAVILETDGSMSILTKTRNGSHDTLQNVKGFDSSS
ncbi:DUF421 domain-containing protein [Sediminibacillus dalangtanensis]|uniref:DUF421 domain-containing protein n=1 Tax=Sediminibacillus dalangtanensis TaxID=2729421 RepID=A0ABX7VNW6_9BACI|nr:YetF domain-containing protein [Sediminibacillus dalangtanensis]QTM98572.1 DUF421 domain-containing protein [Sediminibacillus dalangtanensis]